MTSHKPATRAFDFHLCALTHATFCSTHLISALTNFFWGGRGSVKSSVHYTSDPTVAHFSDFPQNNFNVITQACKMVNK